MVIVKVRETYDLCTTKNKMTVIAIHTPKPDIIKRNYPGLLMQCKAYRPVSCDVRVACASMLPLDPQGIGTAEGDVAPEDVFNPILYKAMTNLGMSQLEARINAMAYNGLSNNDVVGDSVDVDVDNTTSQSDEFNLYYGLLANTHDWRHANPQSGLSMTGLRPLVYEVLANFADMGQNGGANQYVEFPNANGYAQALAVQNIRGNAKPMPFINCTAYTEVSANTNGVAEAGFKEVSNVLGNMPVNAETYVPYVKAVVGAIIVPPSKLHQLFYRLVCEWDIEFTMIRPLSEITDWTGIAKVGSASHYQNYSYSATKQAVTGTDESILDNDSCMVSSNVEVNKVM